MCAVLVAGVIWYACTRGVRVGPEEGSFVQPLLPNFFFNSFPNVDAVYRALWNVDCGLLGRSGSGRVGCGRAGIRAHGHALCGVA